MHPMHDLCNIMPHWRNNSGGIAMAFFASALQIKRVKPRNEVAHAAKHDGPSKNPLRVVPHAQGFHFYRAIGCCIGVTCYSLEELNENVNKVCSESILFHFERGDFQNWIRDIIGDTELAQSIDQIKTCSRQLSAECCREEIAERIRIRLLQLETKEIPPFFGGHKRK